MADTTLTPQQASDNAAMVKSGNFTFANGTKAAAGVNPYTGAGDATYSRLPDAAPVVTPKITPTTEVAPAPVFNETNSRNTQISQRESQFSAINDLYASKIADATKLETDLGAKDMARANTISAMTGNTGGVDATTRAGAVDKKTSDAIKADTDRLTAEKANMISGIFDKIDANVQQEKMAAATTAREDRAKLVDQMNRDAQTNIMAFANNGIDWATASKSPEFMDEVKRTGQDPMTLQKNYELIRASKNTEQTNFTSKVENGQMIATWVDKDPLTGKMTPKYQVTDLPGVDKTYTDSHFDPTTGKLILWDKTGKSTVRDITNPTVKPATPPASQVTEENDAKNWLLRTYGNDAANVDKFASDPAFKAWAIQKAKDDAAAKKNGDRSI